MIIINTNTKNCKHEKHSSRKSGGQLEEIVLNPAMFLILVALRKAGVFLFVVADRNRMGGISGVLSRQISENLSFPTKEGNRTDAFGKHGFTNKNLEVHLKKHGRFPQLATERIQNLYFVQIAKKLRSTSM